MFEFFVNIASIVSATVWTAPPYHKRLRIVHILNVASERGSALLRRAFVSPGPFPSLPGLSCLAHSMLLLLPSSSSSSRPNSHQSCLSLRLCVCCTSLSLFLPDELLYSVFFLCLALPRALCQERDFWVGALRRWSSERSRLLYVSQSVSAKKDWQSDKQ